VGEALAGLGPGVRALFKGPSGTGKTLAARMLAGTLGMDLYRVDLASVVNKYIGETEKNLERVFARAEELDVILLLDEGDALLTQRTGVQSANDRYANLETNYLLQRLEHYEGILLVTTNAGDRIDAAFQRRMDVVVDFGLPDAAERWAIWQLHLPGTHEIALDLLHAAAQRCAMSGAQIRNAALHASLLAVDSGLPLGAAHLEAAVEREYRKQGALSPLRARAEVR
jgi:SpoVK/Ycf46/Vps4 family AAA+-type ATPase